MPESHGRHVCCCIDGDGSGATIAEAARLAGEHGRVSVVHVAPPEPVMSAALTEWGEVDPADPLAPVRAWLERTVAEAGAGEPVLLSGDPPGQEACRWARENDVDLMISRARAGGLRQRVLGSFAAHVAAEAHCAVLLLAARAADAPSSSAVGPYGHVAALTDGSVASLRALDAGEGIATRGRSRISVVMLRSRWRRMIDRALGTGDEAGPDIERRSRELSGTPPIPLTGRPGAELERWARESRADILVLADGAPLGSRLRRSAGALAAEGACAVLVDRAGDGGPS